MNTVDIVLGVVLLLFVINGIYKGFIKNFFHLLGLIASVVLIIHIGPMVKDLVISQFGLNEIVAVVISYACIFLIVMIVVKIVARILKSVVDMLSLKWLNRLLGGVFGLFNGVLILTILVIVINLSPFATEFDEFSQQSIVLTNVKLLAEKAGTEFPVINELGEPIKEKMQDGIDEGLEKGIDKITEKAVGETV